MDWQQAASLVLVLITAALFIRGAIKKKSRSTSSGEYGEACANCSAHAQKVHK